MAKKPCETGLGGSLDLFITETSESVIHKERLRLNLNFPQSLSSGLNYVVTP